MACGKRMRLEVILIVVMVGMSVVGVASQDYGDALTKCILFFEGQRSGRLPSTQRMTWRKDSALQDGYDLGMDLVGGYYDAGDNVKFSFPMAFTTTMLAWSFIEFGQCMGSEQQHAIEALQWGADYFLKATSVPGTVVAQVGDPYSDHTCWERPEDMDTLRTTYVVNETHPGSEVAAEIAAALAASSIVFKNVNGYYSQTLLQRAIEVFSFADKFRGSYNLSVGQAVCPFYCDVNGYMDELVWAAAWLYKATKDPVYWKYVQWNIGQIESPSYAFPEFGWDAKHAGINVLVSQLVLNTNDEDPFVHGADMFVCSLLPESPSKSVTYTPAGLINKGPSNLQHGAYYFLLLVYARYLQNTNRVIHCNGVDVYPSRLIEFTRGQVDYVLGKNPLGMSYMVGYGNKYPQKIHHRGSVLPCKDQHPSKFGCHDGDMYFKSDSPNPNVLVGAIVGGPDQNDQFADSRYIVTQSEPTTYINAPYVGVFAFFKESPSWSNIPLL